MTERERAKARERAEIGLGVHGACNRPVMENI